MPLERDRHEFILNELNRADLEQSQRTELLQELRVDYGTVLSDFETFTATQEKLLAEKEDLVIANSKLFRQMGITENPEAQEKEEKKELSETITIEDLEKDY